jgi:RNA polymerase sigma-B factor
MPLCESDSAVKPRQAVHDQPIVLDVTVDDGRTVRLTVHGDVDMLSAGCLQTAVVAAVQEHRPRLLVIDVAAVPFLDAAGMTALVHGYENAHRHRVGVTLTGAGPLLRRSLRAAGLLDFLLGDGR